jgi:hypothetical protein
LGWKIPAAGVDGFLGDGGDAFEVELVAVGVAEGRGDDSSSALELIVVVDWPVWLVLFLRLSAEV